MQHPLLAEGLSTAGGGPGNRGGLWGNRGGKARLTSRALRRVLGSRKQWEPAGVGGKCARYHRRKQPDFIKMGLNFLENPR